MQWIEIEARTIASPDKSDREDYPHCDKKRGGERFFTPETLTLVTFGPSQFPFGYLQN